MIFKPPIDHFIEGIHLKNLKFWLTVVIDSQNIIRFLLLFLALDGDYLSAEMYDKLDPYMSRRIFRNGWATKHFVLSHSSVFLYFIFLNYICFHRIDPTYCKLINDIKILKEFSELKPREKNAVQDSEIVDRKMKEIAGRRLEFCPDLNSADKWFCFRKLSRQNRTIYKSLFALGEYFELCDHKVY